MSLLYDIDYVIDKAHEIASDLRLKLKRQWTLRSEQKMKLIEKQELIQCQIDNRSNEKEDIKRLLEAIQQLKRYKEDDMCFVKSRINKIEQELDCAGANIKEIREETTGAVGLGLVGGIAG